MSVSNSTRNSRTTTRIPLAEPPAGMRSGNGNLDDLVDYADAQEIAGERAAAAARARVGRAA